MRSFLFGAAVAPALLVAAPAMATVDVQIDLSTQHMHVTSSTGSYDWPVSTAREGYVTPTGSFQVERMAEMYRSKKYDNAPMPHAIFFYYGFAIHGTYETKHLGHTASHGCVRLSPANAAKLFAMVKSEGAAITVSGAPPWQAGVAMASDTSSKPGLFSSLFGN